MVQRHQHGPVTPVHFHTKLPLGLASTWFGLTWVSDFRSLHSHVTSSPDLQRSPFLCQSRNFCKSRFEKSSLFESRPLWTTICLLISLSRVSWSGSGGVMWGSCHVRLDCCCVKSMPGPRNTLNPSIYSLSRSFCSLLRPLAPCSVYLQPAPLIHSLSHPICSLPPSEEGKTALT